MGTFIQTQSSGGGSSITVVANYSALPTASTVSGQFYWCSNSQGTSWLPGPLGGTYYPNGMYYSNGTTWEFIDVPYQATQAEVDAGIVTDKFVTPFTLANASFIVQYERKSDFVNPYHYSGTAPVGTLNSGTWTIKRVDFTNFGSPVTLTATGSWNDRYTLIYA